MHYYSKTTGGFYDPAINGDNIPGDAVEVSREEYLALMAAQNSGKVICGDESGYPAAADPSYTVEEVRARKLSALAAYRYAAETGGVAVSGADVMTDRASQGLIAGAKLYSDLNESVEIDWKGQNGWVTIDRTAILAISQAVAAHVQASFSNERAHAEAIAALETQEEIEAYDITSGWPS